MKIENNILKHYLKNVYFITGTACAGKSTTVKMLAERYEMVFCGENYHNTISDIAATPDVQTDMCFTKGTKHRPVVTTLTKFLMLEMDGTLNKENSGALYED